MPDTLQDAIYILLSTLIVLGVAIIGWLVKQGFQSVVARISAVGAGIDELSKEIRKEREARIRSGARLWGEFIALQKMCAIRHNQPIPQANPDFQHLEDDE